MFDQLLESGNDFVAAVWQSAWEWSDVDELPVWSVFGL